jgi:hypothetical protein
METKKYNELEREVNEIVGFDAVTKRGWEMSPRERGTLIEYLQARHPNCNKEYFESRVPTRRPFDVSDYSFSQKCMICGASRNYCCC